MKQKLLLLLFALLPLVASAQEEINGIYYSLNSYNKTATIASNPNKYSGVVVIPAKVSYNGNDYDVISIAYGAFYNCYALTSVTIPSSVTTIGVDAFYGCSSLSSVHISSVESWCKIQFSTYASNPLYYAEHLFLNGDEIKELVIPEEITSINNYAFYGCTDLTSVAIPNSVTAIGNSAFRNCTGLTSVTIPSCVTRIEDYTFSGCTGLVSLTIPNNVTSIGSSAFSGCSGLDYLIIPYSVKTIGVNAFWNCSGLTAIYISNIVAWCQIDFAGWSSNPLYYAKQLFLNDEMVQNLIIPEEVTSIGNYAFYNCSSITSVTIPNTVTTIGENAFRYCYMLKTLKLSDNLKIISNSAFYYCYNLESLTIPASVEYIYADAFGNCSALESVKVLAETPPFLHDKAFSKYDIPLLVPVGCKEAYQSAQGWKNFTTISDSRYKLTYMVDGEEYKSYLIEYGTAITPEAAPTKDTYKFSGWSEIPETMPAHDVVVTGTFERYFDVGNLTKVINYVMKNNASASDMALYDLNADEELNIGDIILIVKNILGHTTSDAAAVGRRAVGVADLAEYTAAQFEVNVPEGTHIKDIRLVESMEQTHQVMYQQKDANTYAVVVYSLSNQLMKPENGSIVEIETNGNAGDAIIEHMMLATPTGETAYFQSFMGTTGIQQMENESGAAVVYDLKGNRLNTGKTMEKGIYIVNGKKAVVR